MGVTRASHCWDEVWAEFDARQPAPRPVPRSRPPHPPARPLGRPASGVGSLLLLIGLGLATLYLASPFASALQLASAIRRGDAGALAPLVDWEALRPAMAQALASRARADEARPMPPFIAAMARDMAVQLSSPEALTALLAARIRTEGVDAPRDLLGKVRMRGLTRWEVELASPRSPRRALRLTLALTDPWRLRWQLRAIGLS